MSLFFVISPWQWGLSNEGERNREKVSFSQELESRKKDPDRSQLLVLSQLLEGNRVRACPEAPNQIFGGFCSSGAGRVAGSCPVGGGVEIGKTFPLSSSLPPPGAPERGREAEQDQSYAHLPRQDLGMFSHLGKFGGGCHECNKDSMHMLPPHHLAVALMSPCAAMAL